MGNGARASVPSRALAHPRAGQSPVCTELVSCGAGPVRVWVLCREVGCWCEGCAAAPALCSGERERNTQLMRLYKIIIMTQKPV